MELWPSKLSEDHQIFTTQISGFGKMSTSKRKGSTPPSSNPSKKRKHKHKEKDSQASVISQTPTKSITGTNVISVDDTNSTSTVSLFHKARLKIKIAVPPAATDAVDAFLNQHLTSTLLLKHTNQGTILAHANFKSLTNGLGRILDECPFAWTWFEGDVVLFNPQVGQRICVFPTSNLIFVTLILVFMTVFNYFSWCGDIEFP
jgi:hypothetical protein